MTAATSTQETERGTMAIPVQRVETSITLTGDGDTRTAPKYKVAFVIWIAIFPTVLVLSTVLSWLPFEMPRVLSLFVTTAITVPIAVYVLVPWLCRLFDPWVYREFRDARERDTHDPSPTSP